MDFYDLSKEERIHEVERIYALISKGIEFVQTEPVVTLFSDTDTYIRKSGYLAVGRFYTAKPDCRQQVLHFLNTELAHPNFYVRQTVINAAGEIGIHDFEVIQPFMDKGLFDEHHAVRNAVIGSVKKMGQKNPTPVLAWAQTYLTHPDKEIRREICHGIELRGRTHPQDILPLLRQLEFDKTARVRNTLVHVLGQIAYKKGCLETVLQELKAWKNEQLVYDALEEIIDVHHRYRNFSFYTQEQAKAIVNKYFTV